MRSNILFLMLLNLAVVLTVYSQPNVAQLPQVEDEPVPPKVENNVVTPAKPVIPEKKKELRLGNIAGTTSGNEVEFVDTNPSGETNAISGSVSKKGARNWVMRLFNNEEKSYSVSVELVQLDAKGVKVRSDSYSYTIPGKQSREREITVGQNVKSCSVNLKSARQIG